MLCTPYIGRPEGLHYVVGRSVETTPTFGNAERYRYCPQSCGQGGRSCKQLLREIVVRRPLLHLEMRKDTGTAHSLVGREVAATSSSYGKSWSGDHSYIWKCGKIPVLPTVLWAGRSQLQAAPTGNRGPETTPTFGNAERYRYCPQSCGQGGRSYKQLLRAMPMN